MIAFQTYSNSRRVFQRHFQHSHCPSPPFHQAKFSTPSKVSRDITNPPNKHASNPLTLNIRTHLSAFPSVLSYVYSEVLNFVERRDVCANTFLGNLGFAKDRELCLLAHLSFRSS